MTDAQFAKQLEIVRPILLRRARGQWGSLPWEDDLIQETLILAWTSRRSFEGRSTVLTWTNAIMRHRFCHLTKMIKMRRHIEYPMPEREPGSLTHEPQGIHLTAERITDSLDALTGQQFDCVSLYASGLSYKQIGTRLCLREETVNSRIQDGRKTIHSKLRRMK